MTAIIKLSFLAVIFLINDALFNTIDKFSILIIALIALIYLPLSIRKHITYAYVVLTVALLIKIFFPLVTITEGSQIFIYSKPGEYLEKNLPPTVFNAMKNELQKYYPAETACDEKDYCWKHYGDSKYQSPTELYAFSADWRKLEKNFSRKVSYINFDDLHSFKLGAVNNIQYNYYGKDIPRNKLPYYVKYIFPRDAINGMLCFSGNLLIAQGNNHYDSRQADNKECFTITSQHIEKPLYLFSFNPENPLAASTPGRINTLHIARLTILLMLQIIAVFLFVKLNTSQLKNKYLIAILLAVPFNYIYFVLKRQRLWPADFIIYEGGDDGLVHDSKGRWIISNLLQNNWLEALRSDESVFYFMPGLRYLKVPDMFLFGESTYSILLVTIVFAIVMAYLFREAFRCHKKSEKLGYIALLIFLFVHVPKITGLRFEEYIAYGFIGYPSIWSFTLIGIFILYFISQKSQFSTKTAFWISASISLAIILRPNYAILASVLSIYALFVNRHNNKILFFMLCGFSIALLPLLHNFYYGGSFHLFTSNAFHPANFIVKPADYLNLFSNNDTGELTRDKLLGFLAGYPFPENKDEIFRWVLIAFFHTGILYIIISRLKFLYRYHQHYFYLSVALILQHSSFLFWRDHRRYMMFIFALEFLVAIYAYYAKKNSVIGKKSCSSNTWI